MLPSPQGVSSEAIGTDSGVTSSAARSANSSDSLGDNILNGFPQEGESLLDRSSMDASNSLSPRQLARNLPATCPLQSEPLSEDILVEGSRSLYSENSLNTSHDVGEFASMISKSGEEVRLL